MIGQLLEAIVVLLLDLLCGELDLLLAGLSLSDLDNRVGVLGRDLIGPLLGVVKLVVKADDLVLLVLHVLCRLSQLLVDLILFLFEVLNLLVERLEVELVLFLDFAQLGKLIFELVHTLARALVVLSDANGLLGLLHELLLLLLDLIGEVFLTVAQLGALNVELIVLLNRLLDHLSILLKLLLELSNQLSLVSNSGL